MPVDKLQGVHPDLQFRVQKVLQAMSVLGFEMRITDGLRTEQQQKDLYALGRTKPGNIVTNADGVIRKSNHQPKIDGFGHAVDCAFWIDGGPSWADNLPWRCYGECAKALGLKWGGDFLSIKDRPHLELP